MYDLLLVGVLIYMGFGWYRWFVGIGSAEPMSFAIVMIPVALLLGPIIWVTDGWFRRLLVVYKYMNPQGNTSYGIVSVPTENNSK